MKPFQIFRPGKHTSASGQTLSFSEADLERAARVYDPAVWKAPIVVGHPKDNGPAYGWVGAMEFADGDVVASPEDVDPDFAELVKNKRFPNRSASFYAPGSPSHPLAGTPDHDTYYLRHVGFLGAQPPALKGLKPVEFAAGDEGVVEFVESASFAWSSLNQMMRALREWIIGKEGIEAADKAIPNYYLSDLEAAARESIKAQAQPSESFHEHTEDTSMTTPNVADPQARIAALETENATLKTARDKAQADFAEATGKLADAERKVAIAGIKDQLQAHVKAGRLLPTQVTDEAEFIAALDDSVQSFEFSEGEGDAKKTVKESARARYLRQLAARPVAVDFSERAKAEDKPEPEDLAAAQRKINDQFMGRGAK